MICIGLLLNLYVQGIQPLHCVCCGSTTQSFFIPPYNLRILHSSVMCIEVCFSCPQSHPGGGLSPHLWSMYPILPWPVRILFNATQYLFGRSESTDSFCWVSMRLSLLGLLLFHLLFHSVFTLNFPDINFQASLQVGFLDFSLTLGPMFLSFFIESSVFEKHLAHFRISE